jgi:RNA polymerase sigma-70 factor (ECF subfamily)
MLWIFLAVAGTSRASVEDQAAVERMARGDQAALGELYDRHGRVIYSLALRVLRDQGDAEDVVQEVFLQAWREASRFDHVRGNPIAWLLMVTRSRAIDRLRRRQARPALAVHADPMDRPDERPTADVLMEWQSRANDVRRALDTLPLLQRVAVELAFFDGLTHTEIAEQLEVPLGTVKTRVRQGLLKMRDSLAGAL